MSQQPQPIETAPKERWILVYDPAFGVWKGAVWNFDLGEFYDTYDLIYREATHWLPMPPAPEVTP